GAVEAEQLPHLLGLQRHGPLLQLLDQLVRRLLDRQEHQSSLRDAAREGGGGSEDGGAALDVEVGFGHAFGWSRLAHEKIPGSVRLRSCWAKRRREPRPTPSA